MRLLLICLCVVFVCLTTTPAGAQELPTATAVRALADTIVPQQLDKHHIPGALIAVVYDGEVLLATGYGVANKDSNTPVTQDSIFRVGSLSKIVTAALIMRFHAQGKLDLEADVAELIPDLNLPRRYDGPINAIHLMTHSAGFDVTDIADATRDHTNVIPLRTFVRDHMTPQVFPP
ncbi:MAG: serine hydrolase domain-containing protein, partial [Myxococcota bacterium]